jgi:acyl-CoA thioesterase
MQDGAFAPDDAAPFYEHVGMHIAQQRAGASTCTLAIRPFHFNTQGVVHGAVLFTLADTGMGAALVPALDADERCATIEVKINYFRPVAGGEVVCTSTLVHRSRSVASLEADLRVGGELVARASGTFSVFRPRASRGS